MGTSNYTYQEIVNFLFPIWIGLLCISFTLGVLYVLKTFKVEKKKSPIYLREDEKKHTYNYYSKINFWFFNSLFFSLLFFFGSTFLLWGKLSFDLKIYFAYYLFEDDNVGIAYGNFVGFILDVIIFFGLPITTVILSYCIPVKVAKMLLNLKKI